MPERRLSNARVQQWLADDLDRVSEEMASPKALVNSAAVWWFCLKITPEERAKLLGDFVTVMAMRGNSDAPGDGKGRTKKPKSE